MCDSLSQPHTTESSVEEVPDLGESLHPLVSSLRQEVADLKSQQLSYEEQVYQHSITIVSLENKLVESFSRNSAPSNPELGTSDKHTSTDFPFLQESSTVQTPDLEETPIIQEVAHPNVSQKNSSDDSQIRYLQKRIFSLSEKLDQVEARLERSKILNGKLEEALNLKSTLVSKQHSELMELRGSLPEVKSTLCRVQEEVSSISTNLTTYTDVQSRFSPISELAAKCSQDSHAQTIEKQAQALATLRVHVHQLEEANKFIPTHRQAIAEVGQLREELRRAKSALEGTDIAYLMQEKGVEDANLKQLLENKVTELEQEKESHEMTLRNFHSSDAILRELVLILGSKFYKLYRLDFNPVSNISEIEMEKEMESRKKQITEFSSKLSEYEDEIMSRRPAIDAENVREIENLNKTVLDLKSKIEMREDENLSLQLQNELLEKHHIYSPKKERVHSCLFTQEMVDMLLDDERKRYKELLRKKNKEISILRKALSSSHSV